MTMNDHQRVNEATDLLRRTAYLLESGRYDPDRALALAEDIREHFGAVAEAESAGTLMHGERLSARAPGAVEETTGDR